MSEAMSTLIWFRLKTLWPSVHAEMPFLSQQKRIFLRLYPEWINLKAFENVAHFYSCGTVAFSLTFATLYSYTSLSVHLNKLSLESRKVK